FDEELATTLGINSSLMHYLLMTLVAVTTVAAFESVGSILVIAMLIVPAAAAHLLTDRLKPMILISLLIAVVCAVGGHLSAITLPRFWGYSDTETSGMMAVVAGLIFTLAFLVSPRHGVISRFVHQHRLGLRVVGEDILGLIYREEELGTAESVATEGILEKVKSSGRLLSRWALKRLVRQGRILIEGSCCRLTDDGRRAAGQLIRSHRLWESYFFEHTTLPADHVHAPAEKLEHITDQRMRTALEASAGGAEQDPHGKEIPEESP
ncbi:MAG: metal ABC transporter permease, partial [Verrucomicrobiota bacterium]